MPERCANEQELPFQSWFSGQKYEIGAEVVVVSAGGGEVGAGAGAEATQELPFQYWSEGQEVEGEGVGDDDTQLEPFQYCPEPHEDDDGGV